MSSNNLINEFIYSRWFDGIAKINDIVDRKAKMVLLGHQSYSQRWFEDWDEDVIRLALRSGEYQRITKYEVEGEVTEDPLLGITKVNLSSISVHHKSELGPSFSVEIRTRSKTSKSYLKIILPTGYIMEIQLITEKLTARELNSILFKNHKIIIPSWHELEIK